MIPTSKEYIDAMRKKIVTTSAKVEVIDNKYNSGIMIESGNYAIFEGNGFELDGSRCSISTSNLEDYTPRINISTEETIPEGWYSENLSDQDGNITTDNYNTVLQHNKKETSDLHILFSAIREEYAIDFIVSIDGEDIQYTNNSSNEIVIEQIPTGSEIDITITKWSKPYSRAKILNAYLGTVFQYSDEDIVSINCKKGVDLLNEEIESKELEIKLVDKDDAYNIFDEDTELTALDNDARIVVRLGVLIQNFIYYVKIDECYFKKIEKRDNELEMIISGTGIISKYQDINWQKLYNEIYLNPIQLNSIVNHINNNFADLKERIWIFPEIMQEAQTISRCSEKSKNIHDFLNELATNCRCNLIETYDNKIAFRRLVEQNIVAKIGIENMEEYPEIEKHDNKYNIIVNKYNYVVSDSEDEVFSGRFTMFESLGFNYAYLKPYKDIEYLYPNSDESTFVLNIYNSDGTIYASNITSKGGQYEIDYMVLPNTILFMVADTLVDKTFELKFNCKTLLFSNSEHRAEEDAVVEEKIVNVRSIQDDFTAEEVSNWMSGNASKRYEYRVKVNDTCTYEIGDTVRIETGVYNGNTMIEKNAIVVGIEYEYTGALEYYLILRGA